MNIYVCVCTYTRKYVHKHTYFFLMHVFFLIQVSLQTGWTWASVRPYLVVNSSHEDSESCGVLVFMFNHALQDDQGKGNILGAIKGILGV